MNISQKNLYKEIFSLLILQKKKNKTYLLLEKI